MELIVINESKIKIMLSKPDMLHYQLEANKMNQTDEHTRAVFRHIFDDARAEIGFDTTGKRLFIQMFTSREGGCEIFVTKLDDTDNTSTVLPRDKILEIGQAVEDPYGLAIVPQNLSEGEVLLLKQISKISDVDEIIRQTDKSRENSSMNKQKIIIAFSHIEPLLTVCHRLLRDGYRDRSSVYAIESDMGTMWYLTVYLPICDNNAIPLEFSFLAEYGFTSSAKNLNMYLLEHGSCICEYDAVYTLGVL